jgi:hypothetical protein
MPLRRLMTTCIFLAGRRRKVEGLGFQRCLIARGIGVHDDRVCKQATGAVASKLELSASMCLVVRLGSSYPANHCRTAFQWLLCMAGADPEPLRASGKEWYGA